MSAATFNKSKYSLNIINTVINGNLSVEKSERNKIWETNICTTTTTTTKSAFTYTQRTQTFMLTYACLLSVWILIFGISVSFINNNHKIWNVFYLERNSRKLIKECIRVARVCLTFNCVNNEKLEIAVVSFCHSVTVSSIRLSGQIYGKTNNKLQTIHFTQIKRNPHCKFPAEFLLVQRAHVRCYFIVSDVSSSH